MTNSLEDVEQLWLFSRAYYIRRILPYWVPSEWTTHGFNPDLSSGCWNPADLYGSLWYKELHSKQQIIFWITTSAYLTSISGDFQINLQQWYKLLEMTSWISYFKKRERFGQCPGFFNPLPNIVPQFWQMGYIWNSISIKKND